jgi:hypothetical protein
MSHAKTADKLLIKPAADARPAPPRTRGQIHPARRQPGWRASQTDTLAESHSPLSYESPATARPVRIKTL